MLYDLHLGRGTTKNALTVFPIWHRPAAGPAVTLADAGNISIAELEEPVVAALQVTARGPSPVLLLGGDLLVGGRQNRIAATSVLLRPGVPTEIPVRCVEQDRWSGIDSHEFADARATPTILFNLDQAAVWQNVALESDRVGSSHGIDDFVPLPGQSGVLIGIGGRPTVLEVFADGELLLGAWDRIMESVARDATGQRPKATSARRAREFIGMLDAMKPVREPGSVGIGRTMTDEAGPLELRGIRDAFRMLHATVLNHDAVQHAETN